MAATLVAVWDQLVTALQAIDGSGDYTHDVSGTGKVGRARISMPPIGPPYVTVVFEDAPTSHDQVLGTYRRDIRFTVAGWGKCASDTDEARAEAAINMADDILRAVEADRTLGDRVYDVLCNPTAFVGYEAETGAEYPIAVVEVVCWLRVSTGL